jgi:hypothetical protein
MLQVTSKQQMQQTSLMITPLIFLIFYFKTTNSIQINADDHQNLIDLFVHLGIVHDTPDTAERWQAWSAQLVDIECPMSSLYFGCNSQGRVNWINITAPPPPPGSVFGWLGVFHNLDRLVVRDFVGYFGSLVIAKSVEIRDSVITSSTINAFFALSDELTLINVTLPNFNVSRVQPPTHNFTCHFVDVVLLCPVPEWLERCFGGGSPSPCLAMQQDVNFYGVPYHPCSGECSVQCSPPHAPGRQCDRFTTIDGRTYFPTTPGYSTIEIVYASIGLSHFFTVAAKSTGGLLVKLELWDLRMQAWQVVFDDPVPMRLFANDGRMFHYFLPRVLTNRVRATFEQWFAMTDGIAFVSLTRPEWPLVPPPTPAPHKQCGPAVSLDARAMLDETIADSLCVNRICLPSCTKVANYTFEREIRAQYLVVDGGKETRVYQLDGSPRDSINMTLDARRVRLVGLPLDDNVDVAPTTQSPKGLPGIFIKTRLNNLAGLIKQSDDLLKEDAAAAPTNLTLNRNETHPIRKFVSTINHLLIVVNADVRVHDGFVQPLLVNRRLVQTPIDVFDRNTSKWFANLLQHDVDRNITDVDLWSNDTHFAVVPKDDNLTGTLFEWMQFPFQLVDCSTNQDCLQCLTNQANIEPCRWCGSRCESRSILCTNTTILRSNQCIIITNETTTTTTTTTSTTIAESSSSSSSQSQSQSQFQSQSQSSTTQSSTIIGLSIGIPLIILIIGSIVGFLIWRSRRKSRAAEPSSSTSTELQGQSTYDDIESVRGPVYDAVQD